MRRAWPALLALLWLALPPACAGAAEPVPLPALSGRVTDLTGTLDATQRGRLEAQLAAIDRSGRAQIAVLLLPTTQPETIEQFGIRLAEAWKIGRKDADNGVIVIVAKSDRKMRIEVGYGLEGAIPDAIASRIIRERMAPRFKQGDFFGGLQAAVQALEAQLGGAPMPPAVSGTAPAASTHSVSDDAVTLVAVLVMSLFMRTMFGLVGSLLIAGLAGWFAWLVFGSMFVAVIAVLLAFLLSLARLATRANYSASGGGIDSDYSGGVDFGGGGGGGFGGGGASGDW